MANVFAAIQPDTMSSQLLSGKLANCRWPDNCRRVDPALFHITLLFLGPVANHDIPGLIRQFAQVPVPACFQLGFDQMALFKGNGVLYLNPAEGREKLDDLHLQLTAMLQGFMMKRETRRYTPHLTLARKARELPNCSGDNWSAWLVNELLLLRSHTGQGPVRYERLAGIELAPG